jgi:hypothetical protein
MQSLGMLFKVMLFNGTSFTTYPRMQNVHVHDFEKVPDEMYSGEDTTNGRTLKLEMQFNSLPDVMIKDDAGNDVAGPNNEPLVMQRGMRPSDNIVYVYQNFTNCSMYQTRASR